VGLNGIAKTIIGYLASSLGVKLDVDNPGSRFLMTFAFYIVHRLVYVVIAIWLAGMDEQVRWTHSLIAALANGLLAVVLFAMLDKLKERA
jgi:rod shape-determining protein MreD